MLTCNKNAAEPTYDFNIYHSADKLYHGIEEFKCLKKRHIKQRNKVKYYEMLPWMLTGILIGQHCAALIDFASAAPIYSIGLLEY